MVLVVLGQFWVAAIGNISPVTIGAVCGLYLLSDTRLRDNGVGTTESMILSILYANVFVQTFETVYHFSFPVYLHYFRPPFLGGDDVRYLALESVMLLPILLVRRHLSFRLRTWGIVTCFAAIWAVWILSGFPQYFDRTTYYPQILVSTDLFHLALALDFGSKVTLALFFASLIRSKPH